MAGLSFAQMREVVAAARSEFQKGFKETQLKRDYVLYRWWLGAKAKSAPMSHTQEWTIRRTGAQGSTQFLDPFESVTFTRSEYDTSMKITPRTITTHLNMVFDRIQVAANKGSNKLWDDYSMKASGAEEEKAEVFEALLGAAPYNENHKQGIIGLRGWFPRSMASDGSFVAQNAILQNGVYRRFGDGTITASIGGLDASLAANSRLRGRVGTHNNVIDEAFLNMFDDGIQDLGVKYLDQLKGDKPPSDSSIVILWDDTWHREYNRILNKLGGPRGEDYFPNGVRKLSGCTEMPVPSFNGDPLRSIFAIRPELIYPVKYDGMWAVEGEQRLTHNSVGYPVDHTLQVKCEQLDQAGLHIHGQFNTGT